MAKKDEKNPKSLRVGAFIISAINLVSAIVGLLTTDVNLLVKRVKMFFDLVTGKQPTFDPGNYVILNYSSVMPLYVVLSVLLVAISYVELKQKRIPHMITIPGIVLGFLLTWAFRPTGVWESLLGAAVGLIVFGMLFALSQGKWLGFGVVMMEAMLGSFLGPLGLLYINLVAVLLAIIYYFYHYHHKKVRITIIEAGPVLALATGVYLISSVVRDLL